MKNEKPYEQFPPLEETSTDGWRLGTMMSFIDESWGDAFVEAPDGSRAGIVWTLGSTEFKTLLPADENGWGVYQVPFTGPMSETGDLVQNFRTALPLLKAAYAATKTMAIECPPQ